jgi:hypothetical protein
MEVIAVVVTVDKPLAGPFIGSGPFWQLKAITEKRVI